MKKITFIIVTVILVLGCQSSDHDTQPDLSGPSNFLWMDSTDTYLPATGEWTNRIELADINGDGFVDILMANGGNYSDPGPEEASRIFLNQGKGKRFREITEEVFGDQTFYARVIKVRDINGDGWPDIVVGTTFENQSHLYLNSENSKFRKVTESHLPMMDASIGDLEFGDVDSDGDLDMILADWGPGNNMNNNGGITMLWLNNGKGVFEDVTQIQMPDVLIQFSWDLEFVDFDNDFDLDIAVSCKRCGGSKLFINDGKGFFSEIRAIPAYTNNYEFEAMDVNKDGYLDLLTVNDGEIVGDKSYSRREHLFLNQEGKRFRDATLSNWPDQTNIGEDDNNIVFLDYDSDGDPDFLLSSLTGEDRLLINDGSGNFTLRQPILSGNPTPHTLSMVLADINSDHKMDIVMGQGEGKEGIEERVYIGVNIPPDSAAPIIAGYNLHKEQGSGGLTIRARIHDHKSPSMPQDWNAVWVKYEEEQIPMRWYGEHLWSCDLPSRENLKEIEICAEDYCGNRTCKAVVF